MPFSVRSTLRRQAAVLGLTLLLAAAAAGQELPEASDRPGTPGAAAAALAGLDAGRTQDLIILLDAEGVEEEAAMRRMGVPFDDDAVLRFKAGRFRELKEVLSPLLASGETEILREYGHLPMTFVRFRSRRALEQLLRRGETVAVYEDRRIYPHLSYSLPFIGQPPLAGAGIGGEGVGVAVLDSGIDYTLSAFGSCTSPGAPQGCRVAASVDVTGNNLTLNQAANNHGTNVAGIVAGAAPKAGIVSVNVFSQGASTVSWVLAGIDWAIGNRSAYNISSLNMSLGDGALYGSPCDRRGTNPFLAALDAARGAGILPVASSGNSGFTGGMSSPACTPGVVSVGAVYDANWGGPYSFGGSPPTCTDVQAAAPDRIPCFSNSASFLTMLAPGAFVTAAGIQMAGTSQAAPHVAAAAALLRSQHPLEALEQTVARMTGAGTPVTDARNGVTTPRLNLLAALGPPSNDDFAQRSSLPGDSGSLAANNLNATKESGEPAHAGEQGGRSVWWSWTPSESGTATIGATGSGFGTLLSVYTGAALDSLSTVADGAGAGSTATFTALKGTEYLIALDGIAGASGAVVLNRQLTLLADLALTVPPLPPALSGSDFDWLASVTNNGPSPAVGAALTATLPPGVSYVSASPGCAIAAGTVTCGLGDLAPDETCSVRIVINPVSAGVIELAAGVASTTGDPDPANNTASVPCQVTDAPEPVPALSPWGVAACVASLCALLRKGRGGCASGRGA